MENHTSYQLDLFGNCLDPASYLRRESEDLVCPQALQMSLNCNPFQQEIDRNTSIQNQNQNQNPLAIGLRLSFDDEERNSSVTSASGCASVARSIFLAHNENIRSVVKGQKEELDQFIKIQEEQLGKGIQEMKERHVAAFALAIEKEIGKKLMEKEMEIESMNKKNRELVEKINQVVMEAQQWRCRAQYNESIVNVLKVNLQQVIAQGANQVKEGFGDSEIDDTASYVHPNLRMAMGTQNVLKEHLVCKVCKACEVSVLVLPCRHLCVCWSCNLGIKVCPVCHVTKGNSLHVLISLLQWRRG